MSQSYEQIVYRKEQEAPISLQKAIAAWRMIGDETLLRNYSHKLGDSAIPLVGIKFIGRFLSMHTFPNVFLSHPPITTTEDKLAYVDTLSKVSKMISNSADTPKTLQTLTLKVQPTSHDVTENEHDSTDKICLVTGIGTKIVDNPTRKKMAEYFGFSMNTGKNARIANETEWDPRDTLWMEPGIVGPFIDPTTQGNFDLWIVRDDQMISPETPIEIAISTKDSLLVRYDTWLKMYSAFQYEVLKQKFA